MDGEIDPSDHDDISRTFLERRDQELSFDTKIDGDTGFIDGEIGSLKGSKVC